jgi:hypothetical protein
MLLILHRLRLIRAHAYSAHVRASTSDLCSEASATTKPGPTCSDTRCCSNEHGCPTLSNKPHFVPCESYKQHTWQSLRLTRSCRVAPAHRTLICT